MFRNLYNEVTMIILILPIVTLLMCSGSGNLVGGHHDVDIQYVSTDDEYHRIVVEYDHPAVCSISFGRGFYWDAHRFVGASVRFYDDSVVIVDSMNVIREKWIIKVE